MFSTLALQTFLDQIILWLGLGNSRLLYSTDLLTTPHKSQKITSNLKYLFLTTHFALFSSVVFPVSINSTINFIQIIQDKILRDKLDFSTPPPFNSLTSRTNIYLKSVHVIFTTVFVIATLKEATCMASPGKSSMLLNGLLDSTWELPPTP